MLIILASCNCVETHLTDEERIWFKAYEKGQIIVFKSNLGNIDTLVVTNKTEIFGNKECNWYEIGTIQNNIINIDLKSKICRNEPYCTGGISISKDKQDEKSFPSFSFLGLMYSKIYQTEEPIMKSVKLTSNNKTYPYALYFEDKVNANNFGNNYLKSFYWDKKEGLIRYESHEGEIFELLKITK